MSKALTGEQRIARMAKQARISRQADVFARILKVDPERVMVDDYGVALTPDQADALIARICNGPTRAQS